MANQESIAELLSILADGKFHSGEALGLRLGISRAAIWKQLQSLQTLGVDLETQQGVGYRVAMGLDLLSRSEILAQLPSGVSTAIQDLDVRLTTDSTNSCVSEVAPTIDSGHTAVCLSETQSAGRGRRGRSWVSGFAQGLCLSLSWKFQHGVAALGGLSLAVGLVLTDVLQAHGASRLELKWPNDVLFEGRKLAGILVELSGDATDECTVVIGIGLNINLDKRGEIDQPWVNLSELISMSDLSRSKLASSLIGAMVAMLKNFGEHGFGAYRQAWIERAAYLNQSVSITRGATNALGVLVGVDESGALCLDSGGKIQTYNGGELSLRLTS